MWVWNIYIEKTTSPKAYEHYKTFATEEGAKQRIGSMIQRNVKTWGNMEKDNDSIYSVWKNDTDTIRVWLKPQFLEDW